MLEDTAGVMVPCMLLKTHFADMIFNLTEADHNIVVNLAITYAEEGISVYALFAKKNPT